MGKKKVIPCILNVMSSSFNMNMLDEYESEWVRMGSTYLKVSWFLAFWLCISIGFPCNHHPPSAKKDHESFYVIKDGAKALGRISSTSGMGADVNAPSRQDWVGTDGSEMF